MAIAGPVAGSMAQTKAAATAKEGLLESTEMSVASQEKMFNEMMALHAPYQAAGVAALPGLATADVTGGAGQYQNQLQAMGGLDLPSLNLDPFSYQFDPNDPTYQFRKSEMENTINAAAAARGNYNSRPVINALGTGNIALTADENVSQYNRALGTYGTNMQTAMSQYGADYGKATDIYGADRSKLTDLYNMSMQMGSADYGKLIDAVKIGQGSASAAGAGAVATGQGLASSYNQLGAGLSNLALTSGQTMSDLYSGIGSSPYAAYALMNKTKSDPIWDPSALS